METAKAQNLAVEPQQKNVCMRGEPHLAPASQPPLIYCASHLD
jgi:hypothetical protein